MYRLRQSYYGQYTAVGRLVRERELSIERVTIIVWRKRFLNGS